MLYIIQQGLTKRDNILTWESFFMLSAIVERHPARIARREYISVKVRAPATSICPKNIALHVPRPSRIKRLPKAKINVLTKAMRSRAAPAYAPSKKS